MDDPHRYVTLDDFPEWAVVEASLLPEFVAWRAHRDKCPTCVEWNGRKEKHWCVVAGALSILWGGSVEWSSVDWETGNG